MVNIVKVRKKAKEKRQAPPPSRPEPQTPQDPTTNNQQPTPNNPTPNNPTTQHPNTPPPSPDKLAQFVQAAGRRREVRTAAAPEKPEDFAELLTFVIGKENYAIEIEQVVEIVPPRSVTRVPNADPSVLGILSLRGTIVTLIDVRRLLRQPPRKITPETRIVVTARGGDHLGFAVDRVLRVVKIPAGEIEPQPVAHSSEQDESVRGVFRHGQTLTIFVDLNKLLDNRAETELTPAS
jgi:purine-binding chemotaxis protein CheW